MEDSPDLTLFNQSPCQLDGGTTPIIVIQIVFNSTFLSRLQHFLRLRYSQSHWLLAEDVLACFGYRRRNCTVQVLRKRNVHDVDVISLYNFMPICFGFLPTPTLGEFTEWILIATAGNFKDGLAFNVEKSASLKPGIRMGFAHEFIAPRSLRVIAYSFLGKPSRKLNVLVYYLSPEATSFRYLMLSSIIFSSCPS